VATLSPLGDRTTTLFDAAGRDIALVNAAGNRYTFLYDANGQKVTQVDPLDRRTTSLYDVTGNQTGRVDARGNRTTFTFNAVSQLTARSYPDGSRATFSYDATGNQTLTEHRDIAITTVYDPLSRPQAVTSQMDGSTKTIQYAYHNIGNRAYMIDPDGGRFTYVYDANGQLTSLINPQQDRTTFAYNAVGQRTVKLLANGTRASYSYDANGNTLQVSNLKSDNTTISSFDYQYDAINNRTTIAEADGSVTTYLYDAASQFVGEHRTGTNLYRNTFTYDSVQNRLVNNKNGSRTTSTYDAANQLITSLDSTGTTTYTFDADGNQQLVLTPTGDRTTTIWDYENKSTLVELPSGVRNTMTYNPDGLRIKLQDSTGTKRFLWDNQAYLGETDETNTTQVIYTQEPTRYGNLTSQYRKTGAIWLPSYYHTDALGSTIQLTDGTETIVNTYQYDGWGNVLNTTGTTENPFQFTGNIGYYFDPDTEILYIRARTYQPSIGRWWTVDPLGFNDGFNLFHAYFVPDQIDPSGHQVRPAPRKPITFTTCCSYNRFCYNCYGFGFGPQTKNPGELTCTLPVGVRPTAENLSLESQKCCMAKKPSGNWNPYRRCSDWISTGIVGACDKNGNSPNPPSSCKDKLETFFTMLDRWQNGSDEKLKIPSNDKLWAQCFVFCQCLWGTNSPPAGMCMGASFCEPVLGAANPPVNK